MAPSEIFAGNQRNKMHFSPLIFLNFFLAIHHQATDAVVCVFCCLFIRSPQEQREEPSKMKSADRARHLNIKFPKARPTFLLSRWWHKHSDIAARLFHREEGEAPMYSMSIPLRLKGTSRHVSHGQTNLIGEDVLLRLRPGRPHPADVCFALTFPIHLKVGTVSFHIFRQAWISFSFSF